jgi:hypothetical protein
MRVSILIYVLVAALSSFAFAQNSEIRVTANFDSVSFVDFMETIEKQYKIRFYCAETWIDSLIVDTQFTNAPLADVLSNALSATSLKWFLDRGERIILTSGYEVESELPVGFFDTTTKQDDRIQTAGFEFAEEQEKQIKSQEEDESKIYEIGEKTRVIQKGNARIAGNVREAETGEPLVGAVVYIEDPWIGVATDAFGYYSIILPKGRNVLKIQSIGMRNTERQVVLYSDGQLDIDMIEHVIPLKEVIIEAEKDVNVAGLQMGVDKLDMASMKQVPKILGETDVLRIALTLPGVQSVGESASGFNVRGGATDQNLMLLNNAPLYNTSHFFGFFSVFNPDAIKSVELYKSGIPAHYGGRISSVFEVNMRDGNKKKVVGSGGISPVTARLTVEGPLSKDKASFLLSGRSTYSNWLMKQIPNSTLQNSSAFFYDLNGRLAFDLNDKNSLYVNGYYSRDNFKLNSDSLYQYHNLNGSVQWKHIFSNKLYGVFNAIFSQYGYSIRSEENPASAFDLGYSIEEYSAKADFNYFPTSKHKIDFGMSSIFYKLNSGTYIPIGEESLIEPQKLESEQGLENALYISDKYDLSLRLSLYLGLRYSFYHYLGPKTVSYYTPGLPKSSATLAGTEQFSGGEIIKTYHGPEYRLSLRYTIGSQSSIKMSYNRMRQYIHMLSNTAVISPTDTWKLSDPHIRPQVGDQISLGFYRNFKQNTIEGSIEVYYKEIKDFLEFKGGADLILNETIETDLMNAFSKAYGVEVLLKKKTGKLNGWISYTYSRALVKAVGEFASERINNGEFFPANHDKPHDFTIISNYRFNRRFSLSSNFTYSTGRPITYPTARYNLNNTSRIHYSERNQFRIPDYYRWDLSMNIEGNHKIKKLAHSSWTFSVYNVTGRKNVYSIYFATEGNKVNGYKLSIFGEAIPTITYNFRF